MLRLASSTVGRPLGLLLLVLAVVHCHEATSGGTSSAEQRDPAAESPLSIWPKPVSYTSSRVLQEVTASGRAAIHFTNLSFTDIHTDSSDGVLRKAVARYRRIILAQSDNRGSAMAAAGQAEAYEVALVVENGSVPLSPGEMNESYVLDASATGCTITAQSVWGALRGLETFSQVVKPVAVGFQLDAPIVVTDAPRFGWRGLMIDTGRNFLTVTTIKMALDAMSYTKLNVSTRTTPHAAECIYNAHSQLRHERSSAVQLSPSVVSQLLHWHLVDDQSFAINSKALPNLAGDGAFSPRHTYSLADLRAVVSYGRERGIAVLPELDVSVDISVSLELRDSLQPSDVARCSGLLLRLLRRRPPPTPPRRCLGTQPLGRVATPPSKADARPRQGKRPPLWTQPRTPPTSSSLHLWLSSTRSSRPSFHSGTWGAMKYSTTAGGTPLTGTLTSL